MQTAKIHGGGNTWGDGEVPTARRGPADSSEGTKGREAEVCRWNAFVPKARVPGALRRSSRSSCFLPGICMRKWDADFCRPSVERHLPTCLVMGLSSDTGHYCVAHPFQERCRPGAERLESGVLWPWAKWLYPSECFGFLAYKMGETLTSLRVAGRRNLNPLIGQVTVPSTLQR